MKSAFTFLAGAAFALAVTFMVFDRIGSGITLTGATLCFIAAARSWK